MITNGAEIKMSTLISFALKEEAAPFRKIAGGLRRGHHVTILLTGIGRQNAEKSVRDFLTASSAELVLTCGFAGGLNPDLKLGDVVFEMANAPLAPSLSPQSGERVSARTGEGGNEEIGNELEPPYVGCYEKLIAGGAKPAKFFCADRIATTVAEKKKLRHETGADAVEMESAAIHTVCRERGIPCATVRVISDTANEDLPLDFNVLAQPDKSLDYGKLFLAIAKSPGKIGALMKLQKQTRFAAERLAEVLAKIVFP
jgi:adenosylhomocysteine nucleosidase